MKYCCKICGRLNSAENWLDGHLKCSNCGQMVKSIDNAVCIGHFVAERYELKKLLEQKTNTNIYIAFDLFKQCPVLLRLYFWDFTYSVTSSEEFLEIAQSVSHLAQPEHLKIINCGRTLDGMLYTVWPYENLESVTRLLHLNGPIEPGVALSICRDIAVCLDTAYQTTGLGHYNLNTNKIYLTSDGQVRLSDLGHAAILLKDEHFINDENEYFNERFLGPEVTLDEEAPSFQSDMFSLGACLYFMLTGKKPFENLEYVCIDDYYDLKLSKSHEFRLGEKTLALLYRLLAVNPQSRFESWFEVIKESNHCLSLLDGQSTNSRKTRLTTKFDDDFLTDFQEEEYEEAKPQLLNASALSAALNTHKPAVKAHKISTK
ncbi:MAG: protein kinase [Lentisphaerales bacterium]|nr:protein kinase [Lentisphaerales bacterium]